MSDSTPVLHLVPRSQWSTAQQLAPASLASEGFVHCSPDDDVTLAVANAFYAGAERPLLVLTIDPSRCGAPLVWEAADPAPPPGVADDTLFPHLYGPVPPDAVVAVRTVEWDAEGTAVRIG
ncbi:MAG: DUF952 domain-containing protein [Nocardioidaceae bacterium]|nr:DUF952 domain-containing protein [Nocardioidaceae bacterium]